MSRVVATVVLGLVLAGVAAGCSAGSSSSSKKTVTPTSAAISGATVLPNGTVVAHGTVVSASAGATIVAATTARASGSGAVNAASGSTVTVPGTPVPAGTPAPVGTPQNVPVYTPGATFTPSAGGTVAPPVTPASAPDGISFAAPASASGDFDVAVVLNGNRKYHAFQVSVSFESSLVTLSGIDYGGAMGGSDKAFCPPTQIQAGQGMIACTALGPDDVTNAGTLAIYHFHTVGSGTLHLHFTPADTAEDGTFLVFQTGEVETTPIVGVPLQDATVTVTH